MIWPLFAALFGWFFAWIINKTIYSKSNPSRAMYWSWMIGTFIVLFVPVSVLTGLIYKSSIDTSANLNLGILFGPFMIAFYSFLKKPIKNASENLTGSDNPSKVISTPISVVSSNTSQSSKIKQPIQATFEDSYGAAYPNYPVNSPKAMPSPASAPVSNFIQPALQNQPIQTNSASNGVPTSTASDDLWAQALAEYDSASRNQGLWARLFSETQGNEAAVKANYMRIRVDEMQQVIQEERASEIERVAVAKKAELIKQAKFLEGLTEEQSNYVLALKAVCPNCEQSMLRLTETLCPKCGAMFGGNSLFKLVELSKPENDQTLVKWLSSGVNLTYDDVNLLVSASIRNPEILAISSKKDRRTLLHIAAKLENINAVQNLLDNGANQDVKDRNDDKPHQMSKNELVKQLFKDLTPTGKHP